LVFDFLQLNGQSGSGPSRAKKSKPTPKKLADKKKVDNLVLIQTGGSWQVKSAFDQSYGNLERIPPTKPTTKGQKPILPRIVQLKTDSSKATNTIPNERLISAYL
jgi:hypothetical protein